MSEVIRRVEQFKLDIARMKGKNQWAVVCPGGALENKKESIPFYFEIQKQNDSFCLWCNSLDRELYDDTVMATLSEIEDYALEVYGIPKDLWVKVS